MVSSSITTYCVNYDPTVGVGVLKSSVPLSVQRSSTWMSLDNNVRSKQDCNSFPLTNVASTIPVVGNILNNWYVNQTGRGEVGPQNKEQVNIKGQAKWNNLSFLDEQKVTTSETTLFSYSGNSQREQDGTEFWTYKDQPKVTTSETTLFSYSGSAQRAQDGTEFWTYKDQPKVTTKQTTEFSYTGSATAKDQQLTSRAQFTGFGKYSDGMGITGGADTYALRGATLVTNWNPGPGRQNFLAGADARLGKTRFGAFATDQKYDGPGTIRQSRPDGSRYQNDYFIGHQRISPNKLVAIDDRQTAGYQVIQLKNNPLSIYTDKPDADIPPLNCYVEPLDYSPIIEKDPDRNSETKTGARDTAYQGLENSVQVYPTNTGTQINPNASVVYNQPQGQVDNPFLVRERQPNSNPQLGGKCYSGDINMEWDAKGDRVDRLNPYVKLDTHDQMYPGTAQGIPNHQLQNAQYRQNPPEVCEPNPALDFAAMQ